MATVTASLLIWRRPERRASKSMAMSLFSLARGSGAPAPPRPTGVSMNSISDAARVVKSADGELVDRLPWRWTMLMACRAIRVRKELTSAIVGTAMRHM
jgi:hypothetical protein